MITSAVLVGIVRILVGAHARWVGCAPALRQRIYFANHSSHLDTLAIWASLPATLRQRTRPVAARDYWGHSGLRRFIAKHGFNAVYIERNPAHRDGDPLQSMVDALAIGDSLIIFPEGTRGQSGEPQPFKAGLYYIASRCPQAELIPVYLDTLHRVMPKGALIPVPLTCTVRFGRALQVQPGEDRQVFLERARAAIMELT